MRGARRFKAFLVSWGLGGVVFEYMRGERSLARLVSRW